MLNRNVQVTNEGLEMEARQSNPDIIIEDMILKDITGVTLPCEEERRWDGEDNRVFLGEKQGRKTVPRVGSKRQLLGTGQVRQPVRY